MKACTFVRGNQSGGPKKTWEGGCVGLSFGVLTKFLVTILLSVVCDFDDLWTLYVFVGVCPLLGLWWTFWWKRGQPEVNLRWQTGFVEPEDGWSLISRLRTFGSIKDRT